MVVIPMKPSKKGNGEAEHHRLRRPPRMVRTVARRLSPESVAEVHADACRPQQCRYREQDETETRAASTARLTSEAARRDECNVEHQAITLAPGTLNEKKIGELMNTKNSHGADTETPVLATEREHDQNQSKEMTTVIERGEPTEI